MDGRIATLVDLIDRREHSSRLVQGARASDERHRLQAKRYLDALEAFRLILRVHADDPAPEEVPDVVAVAAALGVELREPETAGA